MPPRLLSALAALAAAAACGDGATPPAAAPDAASTADAPTAPVTITGVGHSWPEADLLFHRDPRWLGSDAAYSTDLGNNRILWLFGDTFVATSAANLRGQSEMVRNTIAIQDGRDPTTATFAPAWRTDPDSSPASFFAEDGTRWHWPGGAVRLPDGKLVVFLSILRPTPGQGFGFASDGWRIAIVDDPTGPPAGWVIRRIDPPAGGVDLVVGAAVTLAGDHVVALAVAEGATHATYLARWTTAALGAGDLGAVEYWDGAAWTHAGPPAIVLADGSTEASLHRDATSGQWLIVASRGFGATRIALRSAASIEGAYSAPTDVFTPPESAAARPFVYAGKAHPELLAPGGLAVTYATNSFTFADLFTADGVRDLYWPRFAVVELTAQRAMSERSTMSLQAR